MYIYLYGVRNYIMKNVKEASREWSGGTGWIDGWGGGCLLATESFFFSFSKQLKTIVWRNHIKGQKENNNKNVVGKYWPVGWLDYWWNAITCCFTLRIKILITRSCMPNVCMLCFAHWYTYTWITGEKKINARATRVFFRGWGVGLS